MGSSELLIVSLNAAIVVIAYFYVYPKFCGADVNKIAINDVLASSVSLMVAGSLFWGSGVEFNLILTTEIQVNGETTPIMQIGLA